MLPWGLRLPRCLECVQLWREYGAVTIEYFRLENQLKLASLERHISAIERLTVATEIAAIHREDARENIRQHEANHALPA